jgi:hypothetical protein
MALALLAVALVPILVWAGEDPVSPAEAKAQVTEQLLEILGKTRSTDTFMVTLVLLVESKADVRAIPVVIANAERLGIFDDHLGSDDNLKSKMAEEVSKLILQIQKPGSNKGTSQRYSIPTPNYQAPAISGSLSHKPPAHSTPILPAVQPGEKLPTVAPPSEAEILRALKRTTTIPYLYEEFRDNVQIVTEKVMDKLDDPRFFPLVGPAQLRHVNWKCTVYADETVQSSYPFPFQSRRPRVEVVYIDKDQLHVCANPAGR